MTTISLFPLSGVLLPLGKVPLQIFEQRYIDLVRSSMKTGDPFGIVWIRRGSEVAGRGRASSELGDCGTLARIVDWDQLPNGLLGITIQGEGRFDLYETETQSNGLVLGEVVYRDNPASVSMEAKWQPMLDVLQSLESHPHVQQMGLQLDYGDAWNVAWALIQLLPLEEYLKYELLGLDAIDEVMSELDLILNQISGED